METFILDIFISAGLAESRDALAFLQPGWLWLILLWPVLWLVSEMAGRLTQVKDDLAELQTQQELRVKHTLVHLWKGQSDSKVAGRWSVNHFVFNLIRGIIISLLAVVLAQPVEKLPEPPKPEPKSVRDIVFVIESSASFLLPDYEINGQQETRMNVVKQVLDQFISGLDGNRFSFTIYADKAFTLLPMTYDQTLARLTLKRLKPYLAGRTDVAMGEALGLALKQTDLNVQIQAGNTQQSSRKKVLVLISDGLSLPSRLELTEAVNYAQLLSVPIYTIGVGASSKQADKRLYSGLLYQPLESESLKQIASQTQAQYYQVGSGQEISQVLEKINQAEGVPYTPPPSPPQQRDLYQYPLLLVVFSILFYWLFALFGSGRTKSNLADMVTGSKEAKS